MSDDELDNLLSNFNSLKLSSSSTPSRTVLGQILTDNLTAEPAVPPTAVKENLARPAPAEVAKENLFFIAPVSSTPSRSGGLATAPHTLDPVELSTPASVSDSVEILTTSPATDCLPPSADPFERIRELDADERWNERNTVITALEHRENREITRGIVDNIVDSLNITSDSSHSVTAASDTTDSTEEEAKCSSNAALGHTHDTAVSSARTASSLNSTFEVPQKEALKSVTSHNRTFDVVDEALCNNQISALNTTFELGEASHNLTFDIAGSVNDIVSEQNTTFDIEPPSSSQLNATFDIESTLKGDDTVINAPATALNTTTTPIPCVSTGPPVELSVSCDNTEPPVSCCNTEPPVLCDNTEPPVLCDVTNLPDTIELPVLSDTTESPVLCDITEPLVPCDTTEPPVLSDTTEPPVLCDITEPLVPCDTTEPPVLSDTTEPPVLCDTTGPPVLCDTIGLPVLSDTTETPVLSDITEPLVPCDTTEPPVLCDTTEAVPLGSEGIVEIEAPAFGETAEVESSAAGLSDALEAGLPLNSSQLEQGTEATEEYKQGTVAEDLANQQPLDASTTVKSQTSHRDQPITDQIDEALLTEQLNKTLPNKEFDSQPSVGLALEDEPARDAAFARDATVLTASMGDEEDIPIPRGAYTINWDEIDEFADPFAISKPQGGAGKSLANSPPVRSDADPPTFTPSTEPVAELDLPLPSTSVTKEKDAVGDGPAKKKSAAKKKKTPSKGPSKLADFKKKQAAKLKVDVADGNGLELTLPTKTDLPPDVEDEPLPPPPASYDFDSCEDPFGTKSKVPLSPPIRVHDDPPADIDYENMENPFGTRTKVALSPVKAEPPSRFSDSDTPTAAAVVGDAEPFTTKNTLMTTTPPLSPGSNEPAATSPFLSSAELSCPTAFQVLRVKMEQRDLRQDSPAKDQHSTATNTSQDDEFEDAVDELPAEELFRPAAPHLFDTTADLGVLDYAARRNPSSRESALSHLSLYRKFDPLVDERPPTTSSPAQPSIADQSVWLLERSPAQKPEDSNSSRSDVEKLLDITFAVSPDQRRGPLLFSQNEMEEKENEIRQLKLHYEEVILSKERELVMKLEAEELKYKELEKKERASVETAERYEKLVSELLTEKELSTNASDENLTQLRSERDQYAEDLQQSETAFSDLHKRYDQLREVCNSLRGEERSLRKLTKDQAAELSKSVGKFQELKADFNTKAADWYQDMERTKANHHSELTKMEMARRKAELAVTSVHQQINQKIAENEELTKICDNLIQLKQPGGSS